MFPLKYSSKEKTKEKSKIKYIFFSKKNPVSNTENPKKKDKNRGINISEIGIKWNEET